MDSRQYPTPALAAEQEKVQPLVDALAHLRQCPVLPDEDVSVITAALAKVKEGKQ